MIIRTKSGRLVLATLLGGLVLFGTVIFLLGNTLNTVAQKANEIDARRARATMQSAIVSDINSLDGQVKVNTFWDDAVTKTYVPQQDTEWLNATWGTLAADDADYDGVYLIDEKGHLLWKYTTSKFVTGPDLSELGATTEWLIHKELAHGDTDTGQVSGLSRTADGPAIISIGLIQPSSAKVQKPSNMRRYLILTRHLSPLHLTRMSKAFGIKELHFVSSVQDAASSLTPLGADGKPVGILQWQAQKPGIEAAAAARPDLVKACIVVALLIAAFVITMCNILRGLYRSEATARQAALTDSLSGLPNRRALMERIDTLYQTQKSAPNQMAVLFMNLDSFKDVNDTYGHATGDALIFILAQAFSAHLPDGAFLARLGGDEFAALIFHESANVIAEDFAKDCLNMLKEPVVIGDRTIQISASIGIADTAPKDGARQELFRRADIAMCHAKTTGKGRITRYSEALEADRRRQQEIENDIRQGLLHDEFEVLYQPILDSASRIVIAYEALVRWPRRPQGVLTPDQFIPVAESSGLIHALGLFVLNRACRDMRDRSDVTLCVNISPAQFRDPDFENHVATVLAETGFPAARLELEVTEGYLIDHPERALTVITALKRLGISIALDDFGTGYSSIAYLKQYGFDKIKIDKSLAGEVEFDSVSAALVAGTVAIARALSISVTAEGVEREEQAALLHLAGCQNLQGFLYSRAVPINQISPMAAGTKESSVA